MKLLLIKMTGDCCLSVASWDAIAAIYRLAVKQSNAIETQIPFIHSYTCIIQMSQQSQRVISKHFENYVSLASAWPWL